MFDSKKSLVRSLQQRLAFKELFPLRNNVVVGPFPKQAVFCGPKFESEKTLLRSPKGSFFLRAHIIIIIRSGFSAKSLKKKVSEMAHNGV